jgi:hypothetical protein
MNPTRPDGSSDPAHVRSEAAGSASPQGGPPAPEFSDSEGGLFSGPASLLPDMEAAADEPPVRSLFAPRGLFRP